MCKVSGIYYLADIPTKSVDDRKEDRRGKQIEFVKRTAGKIEVDENAVEELRMRSMIW